MDFTSIVPHILEKIGSVGLPVGEVNSALLQEVGKQIAQKLFARFPSRLNPESSTADDVKKVIDDNIYDPSSKEYWEGIIAYLKTSIKKAKVSQFTDSGVNQYTESGNVFKDVQFQGRDFDFSSGKK